MFETLLGNPQIKSYLERVLASGDIPHALLFAGPEGVGKALFAREFAAVLTGIKGAHPDLHEYYPEGKIGAHSMETMRSFIDEVSLAPYKALWKIFIIHEAERMLPYSANALLKTFEEPTPRTVILLISSHPELLLPTILSRCRTLHFKPISREESSLYLVEKYSLATEAAQNIAMHAKGSLGQACRIAEEGQGLFESCMLPILSKGGFSSFNELTRTAKLIAEKIDLLKEEMEAAPEIEMTAVQLGQWEKSRAGEGAVKHARQAFAIFEGIAGWYRDMELLNFKGPPAAVWHGSYQESMLQAIQGGCSRDLDLVLAAIKEASLSLQRSTPLQSVLETLFLRLKLL